jgi:acetolactate synthase-1/2/3 large subunit
MRWSERPVIVIGHGCRLAGVDVLPLLQLGVPLLTSWPAADLVDSGHPRYFGRPGAYGQRCANKVLANADTVLAIGCRLSIWTAGHDFPRNGQRVLMVDCDECEIRRIPGAEQVGSDIAEFIKTLAPAECSGWMRVCETWRTLYPWLEHDDQPGFINPHRFMARMQPRLREDEIIVADCATGSLAAHQILKLKPPQRLMTSGGLGEMGCGLPAAIGASFARNKGEVICLSNDGGMMLTLQELQTVAHHDLPIKIVVFSNDGYGMIRDTQRNLGYRHAGVDRASGVSCPDFVRVAQAFDISAINGTKCIEESLDTLFRWQGPMLMQVDVDPAYVWTPKLRPGRNADGSIKHAVFEEMS